MLAHNLKRKQVWAEVVWAVAHQAEVPGMAAAVDVAIDTTSVGITISIAPANKEGASVGKYEKAGQIRRS